jgi:hypothetical protein
MPAMYKKIFNRSVIAGFYRGFSLLRASQPQAPREKPFKIAGKACPGASRVRVNQNKGDYFLD